MRHDISLRWNQNQTENEPSNEANEGETENDKVTTKKISNQSGIKRLICQLFCLPDQKSHKRLDIRLFNLTTQDKMQIFQECPFCPATKTAETMIETDLTAGMEGLYPLECVPQTGRKITFYHCLLL